MERTLIIAEAGVNHNGSLDLAKKLVDVAAEAGADYVKFQTFVAEKLASKNAKKAKYQTENMKQDSDDSQFNMLKKLELTHENHHKLIDYCSTKGVKFLSTAFDLDSIDFLDGLGIDFYKIPSGEITNKPYLEKVASLGLPVILSTGMANMKEISDALLILENGGVARNNITVLHCNTEYPTPAEDVNLKAMISIHEELGVKVGYSDHTLGIIVPISAVSLGATVIEKHFTLDKDMEGPDHKASLDPLELKEMISSIRYVESILGDGVKQASNSEKKNIVLARKSIHLNTDLKAGDVIKREHLIMKRPGDGISPMEIENVIGKSISEDLFVDHKINSSDLI